MKLLFRGLATLLVFPFFLTAQPVDSPDTFPEENIPELIAKAPERADFFGKWLRYDGTYQLAISPGEKPGSVTVSYYNPGSINVESAVFTEDEGGPILTVVLRDEGYPGSTYRLIFFPQQRTLAGLYERPGAEPAEVYFLRIREKP